MQDDEHQSSSSLSSIMQANSASDRLNSIEQLLDAGHVGHARTLIGALAKTKLTREQRLKLAYLANQAFFSSVSLTLLKRVIHPPKGSPEEPTPDELIEYGLALTRIGAVRESIPYLTRPELSRYPRAARSVAFAFTTQWRWDKGVEILENVLDVPKTNERDHLALLNGYAICLTHGRRDFDKAEKILKEVISSTTTTTDFQIHSDAWQLLSQVYFLRKDWKEALRCLKAVDISGASELHRLLVERWFPLIRMHQEGYLAEEAEKLFRIREGFSRLRYFEFARSCDYYLALATKRPEVIHRFYFGTPIAGARRMLLENLGMAETDIPEVYFRGTPNDLQEQSSDWIIEAFSGTIVCRRKHDDHRRELKRGQLLHRLMRSLCQDAYAHFSVGRLHEELYPEQYFRPDVSQVRIWQAVKRLRQWLKDAKTECGIRESEGFYQLEMPHGSGIRLGRPQNQDMPAGRLSPRLREILSELQRQTLGKPFKSKEIEAMLDISRPTVVSLLQEGIDQGVFEKRGSGPATHYLLIKAPEAQE